MSYGQYVNTGVPRGPATTTRPGGRSDDSAVAHDDDMKALKTMAAFFGNNAHAQGQRGPFSMRMGTGDEPRTTRGHATTGIPYAIAGTAKVVEMDVAERLTAFSDPIKAILGTGVHGDEKVIIKRQYVAGGGASIVPERAAARTIALQEDVREVHLTRYGADIEFNMNLLLRPEQFQREMNMKVNAQQESLQQELVKIGYDMLMTEGTSLMAALVASNPVGSATPLEAQRTAERIYVSSVFGAMQRFPYPVHNLLAAAKHAAASTIATAPKTVLIVPSGLPELHRYTKPENMNSYIHGVTHGDPLTATVTGGATDVGLGTTVFTHVPPVSNAHGAANPVSEGSLLANDVHFATFAYNGQVSGNQYVYDLQKRSYITVEPGNVCLRIYKVSMLSAILAVPNGDNQATGEMLVGYPSTMLGNDVATEVGRMRLRVYMGSVLYRPENVMILPDVAWNGVHGVAEFNGTIGNVGGTDFDDLGKELSDTIELLETQQGVMDGHGEALDVQKTLGAIAADFGGGITATDLADILMINVGINPGLLGTRGVVSSASVAALRGELRRLGKIGQDSMTRANIDAMLKETISTPTDEAQARRRVGRMLDAMMKIGEVAKNGLATATTAVKFIDGNTNAATAQATAVLLAANGKAFLDACAVAYTIYGTTKNLLSAFAENGDAPVLKAAGGAPTVGPLFDRLKLTNSMEAANIEDSDLPAHMPVYRAAKWNSEFKQITTNSGHLGALDGPECGDRVFGINVYQPSPDTNSGIRPLA